MAILKDALVQGDLVTTGNIMAEEIKATTMTADSFNGTATYANTLSTTLPATKGGTGQTSAVNAANAFANALTTGASAPTDADYYIAQYAGGGTTTTTYHRRPHSALWTYIKGKADAVYAALSHNHAANDITSGTLPVNRGGTGAATFTSGAALIGSGTSAVTTRSIRNNTATSSAITADTNLITSNTLRYAINRTTSVAAADTNYTTYMARGMALNTSDTNPTVNGAISWTYK